MTDQERIKELERKVRRLENFLQGTPIASVATIAHLERKLQAIEERLNQTETK